MSYIIDRPHTATLLNETLERQSAVALLGARQLGKTTLARQIARERNAHLIDLDTDRGRALMARPQPVLESLADKLVILDEVQRAPQLFPVLRSVIDSRRAQGRGTGQFLLLGSASMQVARQSAESLAGRLATLQMHPLTPLDIFGLDLDLSRLWLRGGFPMSYLAPSDNKSALWRADLRATYLERDLPAYTENNPRLPSEAVHRLWQQLAWRQGEPLNTATLANHLSITGRSVERYISLLEDLLLLHRLWPAQANSGRRLSKAPRLFICDSGLMHEALGIDSLDQLLAHPCMGKSWEGWVIANLLACAPQRTRSSYYRSSGGAEIDLLLELPNRQKWAIDIQHGLIPKPSRGFHSARMDAEASHSFVVHGGAEEFPLADDCTATGLPELMARLMQQSRQSALLS